MTEYYQFPCNCKFPIIGYGPNGIPRLDIPSEVANIPMDCARTWDMLSKGLTLGIFQLESKQCQGMARKLKPRSIAHLAALISIIRPGVVEAMMDGKNMANHYIDRKNMVEPVTYFHPSMENSLKNTYGICIYQEQILQLVKDIAGFTMQESEILRKCVTNDTMFVSKQRGWISIKTLLKTGYNKDLFLVMDKNGKQIWKKIDKIWETGTKSTQYIESNNGFRVNATGLHQFLTDDGWKARKRINENDYLVCAKSIEYDGIDTIPLPLAMIIAGILTEGHFPLNNKCCNFTAFEPEMMKIFDDNVFATFGEYPTHDKDKKIAHLPIKFRNVIGKYIPRGLSAIKELPELMMGMTLESTRQFLSFMFAAECSINKEDATCIEYTSKCQRVIEQIQLLLLRFGIRSNRLVKHNTTYGDFYRLYISSYEDQLLFKTCGLNQHFPLYKQQALDNMLAKPRDITQFTSDIIPQRIVHKFLNQYPHIGNYEGGSVYKGNISRKRFLKFAIKSNDNKWINFAQGKQCYSKAVLGRYCNERTVYDFTIEGNDTPYIIANGLVIHNSIGKKIPEIMSKCKIMFLNGCKKQNIVTEKEAEQIFEWIQSSQRYLFNLSHGVSYAYNAYLSAYMKSHFPRAFYTSYLHHAQNQAKPFEEIRGLVRDARLQGVKVLGPDIRYLYKHFTLLDKNIRFGLVDIKGIGEKEYEKFLKNINTYCEKKSKKIDDITWLEFLLFISPKINSTMCTALIQGGALLYMGVSRTQMCFEYETFNKLSTREQEYIISSTSLDTDLSLTTLAQLVQRVITAKIPNKTRMKVVEGIWRTLNTPPYSMIDSPAWIAQNEINLFGIALSCCGLEGCDINEASATCEDFLTQLDTQVFAIAVTLDEIKEIKTKNGKNPGQQMAFTTVSDNTGNMECVIFPDVWKEIRPIMFAGNNVLIYGERSKDKNSCIIKNAQQI